MFNFDLFKLDTLALELNSFCNLQCGYCPRVTYDFPVKKEFMKDNFIDFIIDNIINSSSLEWIELNGYNQVIYDKSDINKLNKIIKKIKEKSNKDIKFKICTNGSSVKNTNFYDILNLDVDITYFTKHNKEDFWIEDLVYFLKENSIFYTRYIHKENINKEIIIFNNRMYIFMADSSNLTEENKSEWKQLINKNKYSDVGYYIINVGNKCKYLDKSPITNNKDNCLMNYPMIDYRGYVLPCFARHSLFKDNLEYGHLEEKDGKVIYIKNDNIDWNWCTDCQNDPDCNPGINLDNYVKIEF